MSNIRLSRHTQAQNEAFSVRRLHTHRRPRVELVGEQRRQGRLHFLQPSTPQPNRPGLVDLQVRYYIYFNPPQTDIEKGDEIIRHSEIDAAADLMDVQQGVLKVGEIEDTPNIQRLHCYDLNGV